MDRDKMRAPVRAVYSEPLSLLSVSDAHSTPFLGQLRPDHLLLPPHNIHTHGDVHPPKSKPLSHTIKSTRPRARTHTPVYKAVCARTHTPERETTPHPLSHARMTEVSCLTSVLLALPSPTSQCQRADTHAANQPTHTHTHTRLSAHAWRSK